MNSPITIGVSACLLGQPVRYDGGHRLDPFLAGTLGRFATLVPVCPEAELGLGVPREPMRLEGDPNAPRLITIQTGRDLTEPMRAWAARRVAELEGEGLWGFIFKSRSPSSGMERVKVYRGKGPPVRRGVGLFARAFMERFPLLPVEEEDRLQDPELRENFIIRLFALQRWRDLLAGDRSRGGLVAFHAAHKLLLLSHSEKHYRRLGRLVAEAREMTSSELFSRYESLFLEALRHRSTVAKNRNVLLHILGYFKRMLASDQKEELLELIDHYRQSRVPLLMPITLMNHHARQCRQPYLAGQLYLHPHPLELKLRYHA